MNQSKFATTVHNTSRILLAGFVAALFLILPQLNISEYVLPTITTKLIYFLYGSLILLGLYSIMLVFTKSISFSFCKLDIALMVLVLYITLNRYFIQPHYGFSIRYIELLGLSFLYVVLRSIGLKNYPWLLLVIVVSGIIQAIYGNLQLLGYYSSNHSGFKMTGSFFNPGPYAGFLVSVWTVALGMYLFKDSITTLVQSKNNNQHKCNIDQLFNLTPSPSPKERGALAFKTDYFNQFIKYLYEYIPLLGLISISLVLPALQSRASWIAAIVGSAVLVEFRYRFLGNLFKKVTTKLQKTILIVLAIGIISAGLFSIYHYKKASSDGRAFIWKITTEMIADAPVFGVGFDKFKTNYMNYQANYFAKNGETTEVLVADNVYYAFNEWLQFVAENGLLGFLMLLIVLFVLFQVKAKQTHIVEAFIAKTGLLCIGVFACFSYPTQILPIKIVIVTALALLACLDLNVCKLKLSQNNVIHSGCKTSLLIFAIIGITKGSLYINELDKGFKTWQTASNPFLDYETALKEYETAYPLFKKEGDFLMGYGKTLSLAEKHTKAIAILQEAKCHLNTTVIEAALGDAYKGTKQYKKAEIAYKEAYNMSPSRFYPMYLLAKLYDQSNNKKKAVVMANNILYKEVKIPSTAIKEIREEMKKILIKYKNPKGH